MRKRNQTYNLSSDRFSLLKSYLPELKVDSFKSESPTHDLLFNLHQQGELLFNPIDGLKSISGQLIRLYVEHSLPEWVPMSDMHKPDGYWKFPDNQVVALEVDTSIKSYSSLAKVMYHYGQCPNISRVVWLVKSLSYERKILQHKQKELFNNGEKHNIIFLADFIKILWQAKRVLGPKQDLTLSRFVYNNSQTSAHKPSKIFLIHQLLDLSISPRKHSKKIRPLQHTFVD